MQTLDLSRAQWRKSSFSGANGSCVEVAPVPAGRQIAVRDTKDRQGPALIFGPGSWRVFAAAIKEGSLDLI